jgi:uncharacterized protein (DUF983 family)
MKINMGKAVKRIKSGKCPKCGRGKPTGNNVYCNSCIVRFN